MRIGFNFGSSHFGRALLCGALGMMLLGCPKGPGSEAGKNVESISGTAPKLERLPATTPIFVARPPVASEGDCAPSYANGLVGTCVDNKPCRGFGVRSARGAAVCACYARDGGCDPGSRCDAVKKTCVPAQEAPWGRPVAR
jgi:hypothetical protein